MKLRRVLLPLLLALLTVGVTPHPAYAGGPTSVLMVNPERQRAAAAYLGDPVYAALTAAVGEGQTGPNAPPAGLVTDGGEGIRLTWMIHDVQAWRIDRIHRTSADGVWIETVVDLAGEGSLFDVPASWHRPADEGALVALLSQAGLLGDSGPAPTGAPAAEAEATVPASGSPVPGSPVPEFPGLRLLAAALAGLVLGVAGTLVGVRARSRTLADSGPRVTLSG